MFLDVRTDPTENVWPMVQGGQGHHRRCCWVPRTCDRVRERRRGFAPDRARQGPAGPGTANLGNRSSIHWNRVARAAGYRRRTEERAEPIMKHIIALLLENEAGALSRVVACSRRAATTSRA